MVIDTTTGRGCAYSMIITKKLIADGIVGKAIFRKPYRNRYNLFRVVDHGMSWVLVDLERDKLAEEALWLPSFIDPRIWEQAVSKFQTVSLKRDVAKYLLPEMSEYLQSIPDMELISMTREFLIEHGVVNKPIRQKSKNTYYFDENEVYSLDEGCRLFPYEGRLKFHMFEVNDECFNMNVWIKAATQFEVGMTLKECVGIFLKTELTHNVPQELSPLDQLIQYIAPPVYERVPGNDNKKTFDRIRVTVGLPRYQFNSWGALQGEVKKYQHEIYQRVVQKLETDYQFKRYGVPLNFLKLSDAILLRDFSLEFIFELKEQQIDVGRGIKH